MLGTVAACSDDGGFALLGWNVNQALGSKIVGTWLVPSSGGIGVIFSNPDGVDVRLQVVDSTGISRCVDGVASGVLVPWTSFVVGCWVGGGSTNPLVGGQTEITQAGLSIPGASTTPTSFKISVTNVVIQ
jgi:hypothetical protein